jgi:hypothetical protein
MATLAERLLELHAGRGSLVGPALAASLFAPHARISRTNAYGYGLGIDRAGGRLRFGHAGDMVGFRCSLLADPAAGVAVVVLTNLRGAPTRGLARHALALGIASDPASVPALQRRPAIDGTVGGSYVDADGTADLRVDGDSATLEVDGREVGLRPIGDETFEVVDPAVGRHRLHLLAATRRRGAALALGTRLLVRDGPSAPSRVRADARAATYRSPSDPWMRSVEVLVRDGSLRLVDDEGEDSALVRVTRDRFRIGDEPNPERAVFDAWTGDGPQRVTVSGRPLVRDA